MKRSIALLALLWLTAPVAVDARPPQKAAARRVQRPAKKAAKRTAKKSKKRRGVRSRPVPVYTAKGLPNIQARSALIVDLATGTDLFTKNPDEVRPIASLSKLTSMMVVLDRKLDLAATTAIIEPDRRSSLRGARSRLLVGQTYTNQDLLHAVLMASDNRAVPALGRAVGLAPEQLVQEMNRKARDLGLQQTSFGDPTGLDVRNRSTTREVAKTLAAALKYPLISEITQKPHYLARAIGGKRPYQVEYANTDVYTRSKRFTVLGGKTGYNDQAGYCLAISARLESGREVTAVFLGAQGKMTRFADFARAAQWIAEKNPQPPPTAAPKTTPAGTPTAQTGPPSGSM
jgi:serine-type D-Ala-D-Ala endopeptidase (penicillin-binding protein 7)